MVEYIEKLDDFLEIIKSDKLVIVDFTATWCGPCKRIAPEFENLSTVHTDCIFKKVDVDEGVEISEHCEISSMPTFHFYKNDKMLDSFSGANIENLKAYIAKYK